LNAIYFFTAAIAIYLPYLAALDLKRQIAVNGFARDREPRAIELGQAK